MLKARSLALLILASPFVVSLANAAPITLEGMGQIKQWTDFESESASPPPMACERASSRSPSK